MTLRTFKVSFFRETSNLIGLEAPSALTAVAAAKRAFEQEHYDACTDLNFHYAGFEAREVTRTPYQVTFVHRQYYDEEIVATSAEEAVAEARRRLEKRELDTANVVDECTDSLFAHPVEGGSL